jgi:malate synthase
MKELNYNIVYSHKSLELNSTIFLVYISVNLNNQSVFVYKGFIKTVNYNSLLNECLKYVLKYLNLEQNEIKTINPNVVEF